MSAVATTVQSHDPNSPLRSIALCRSRSPFRNRCQIPVQCLCGAIDQQNEPRVGIGPSCSVFWLPHPTVPSRPLFDRALAAQLHTQLPSHRGPVLAIHDSLQGRMELKATQSGLRSESYRSYRNVCPGRHFPLPAMLETIREFHRHVLDIERQSPREKAFLRVAIVRRIPERVPLDGKRRSHSWLPLSSRGMISFSNGRSRFSARK